VASTTPRKFAHDKKIKNRGWEYGAKKIGYIRKFKKKQADISCFLDLIDDYMALYDIKKKLKTDIKKRGVSYEAQSASGKATIIKQNQSVKDLVAVNKQMLMILDKLGLTTEKTIRDDDDDKL